MRVEHLDMSTSATIALEPQTSKQPMRSFGHDRSPVRLVRVGYRSSLLVVWMGRLAMFNPCLGLTRLDSPAIVLDATSR